MTAIFVSLLFLCETCELKGEECIFKTKQNKKKHVEKGKFTRLHWRKKNLNDFPFAEHPYR